MGHSRLLFMNSHFLLYLCSGQGPLRWGSGGAAVPSALFRGGAGGARIALNTEIFASLLSREGAFSGMLDSFFHDTFSGGNSPDPNFTRYSDGTNMLNIFPLEESLKTRIYPCE